MLCSKCNEKEATVHIVAIINGEKKEINLCEDCAKTDMTFGIYKSIEDKFDVNDVLGGMIEQIYKASGKSLLKETVKCDKCGTTYESFKSTGLLGCVNCYKVFEKSINPVISNVQSGREHEGKIPSRIGSNIAVRRKLKDLKIKLQEAIVDEQYETAAEIRDQIREVERG